MNTTMRKVLSAALTVAFSVAATAEDIDLYVGGAEALGIPPNALLILDNSANWNNASQAWPDGGPQGQSEVKAISTVLTELGNDSALSINVGLMMLEDGTPSGGNVRFAVRDLQKTYSPFSDLVSHINIGLPDQISRSSNYDTAMNDAFRYFNGFSAYGPTKSPNRDYEGNDQYLYGTGGNSNISTTTRHPATAASLGQHAYASSGTTTYLPPGEASAGCSRNFIIFIGNGFPSSSGAKSEIIEAAKLLNDPTVLTNPVIADLNDPATEQIYASSKIRYADEWARFMKRYGAKSVVENPNRSLYPEEYLYNGITTYTINVCNAQCDPDQEALMKSMAKVGGGKYFKADNEAAIINALKQIFMEVQAVNSVFTSATLPVSVNTQGTYENQIYMGMFRPDGAGRPRWFGNLKEYQFGIDRNTTPASLYLADKIGERAILGLTGFITETATSFWTTKEEPGFWAFSPSGSGKAYDLPDGPMVEKGGAAQRLRQTFAGGRKVYTHLGGNADLTHADNAFNKDSTGVKGLLTTAKFGKVKLSRDADSLVVTASGTGLPDFKKDEEVIINRIADASTGYDGTYRISSVGSGSFTFDIPAVQPASPATADAGGVITATGQVAGTEETVPLKVNFTLNEASATVTGSYAVGDFVLVADAATPKNPFIASSSGLVKLTGATTSPVTIGYLLPPFSCRTTSGAGAVSCGKTAVGTKKNIVATINRSGQWLMIGLASTRDPVYFKNATVEITAADIAWFNRIFTIAGTTSLDCGDNLVPPNGFCIALPSPTEIALVKISKATNSVPVTITRSAETATATTVGGVAHSFDAGKSITIAGAAQSQYNGVGKVVLSTPTSSSFTYKVDVIPEFPVLGDFLASNGPAVSKEDLIDWVRGVDNAQDNTGKREDENVNNIYTDVRASVHGDVLHSRPLVINYGKDDGGIQVFYGVNDGTLRSVQGGTADTDGVENWAFIPTEFIERNKFARLYANAPLVSYPNTPAGITPTPRARDYFWDGNIGVYQSPDGTATTKPSKTYIFPTTRRGGRFLYGIDVTTPTLPKFLWKIHAKIPANADLSTKEIAATPGYEELGYTWSEPKAFKVKGIDVTTGAEASKDVLVFGAGYDPEKEDTNDISGAGSRTMGLGVFITDLTDGSKVAHVKPATPMQYSFPADISAIDIDGDGYLDRVYAGDTGGNLWRIDIDKTKVLGGPDWAKIYHLAKLGDVDNNGGADNRKFLYPPEILPFVAADKNGLAKLRIAVLAGSGNREQPLLAMTTDPVTGKAKPDQSKLINDKFFMVIDGDEVLPTIDATKMPPETMPGAAPAEIGNLVPVDFTATPPIAFSMSQYPDAKGWVLDLIDSPGLLAGEKVVNAPVVDAGICFFATNVPKEIDRNKGVCSNLGDARAYAVSPLTGAPAFDRDASGVKTDADYFLTFSTGGMAPTMTSGIVDIKNDKGESEFFRFQIGSGGSSSSEKATDDEKSSVGGAENPIDLKGPRSRVYWYYNAD